MRPQIVQYLMRTFGVIADQQHVAAGVKRAGGTGRITAGKARSFHAQVVTEDDTPKAQLCAQHLLQPVGRESRG
jgi:hypothetical protein